MAIYDIAPGFVKFEYHSAAGPHVALIPTRQWYEPTEDYPQGFFRDWDSDASRDALLMITDMADAIANFLSETSMIDRYTIYTKEPAPADPIPRITGVLATPGVDDTGTWESAVQLTMSYRSEDFHRAKLVILDAVSGGVFAKVQSVVTDDKYDTLNGEFMAENEAWSARDGTRPTSWIGATWTLNEKLRRAYRLD